MKSHVVVLAKTGVIIIKNIICKGANNFAKTKLPFFLQYTVYFAFNAVCYKLTYTWLIKVSL